MSNCMFLDEVDLHTIDAMVSAGRIAPYETQHMDFSTVPISGTFPTTNAACPSDGLGSISNVNFDHNSHFIDPMPMVQIESFSGFGLLNGNTASAQAPLAHIDNAPSMCRASPLLRPTRALVPKRRKTKPRDVCMNCRIRPGQVRLNWRAHMST